MLGTRNNLIDAARIEVELRHKEQSLAKDIIETITGISGSALSAGGRITTETVVYSGESTPNPTQQTFNQIFFVGSLTANILDFLLVPCGYLYYKLWRKEPVPFNTENNLKWAMAALTLTLAIISTAARVTSMPISFISSGFAIVFGGVNIIKYFYDLYQARQNLNLSINKIETLSQKIQSDLAIINELHNYPSAYLTPKSKEKLLQLHQARLDHHSQKLQAAYYKKHDAERVYQNQKSPIELVDGIVKVALAFVVLAGTIVSLNPATIWIGMGLIAAVAVTNLIFVVAKKTYQLIQKRRAQKTAASQHLEIEITPSSTHTIITAFGAQPEISQVEEPKARIVERRAARSKDSETVLLLAKNEKPFEENEHDSDSDLSMSPSLN